MTGRQYVVWKKTTREPDDEVGATRRMMEQLLLANKLPTKITVDLDLSKLSATTKNKVIKALEDGVLFSSSGVASQVYELMARKHKLPIIKVRKQAKFNDDGSWNLFMRGGSGLNNAELVALFQADRVACRLAGYPVHASRSPVLSWNESEFAANQLMMVKDETQVKEAVKVRLTPEIQRRAARAIKEIKVGSTIRFTY